MLPEEPFSVLSGINRNELFQFFNLPSSKAKKRKSVLIKHNSLTVSHFVLHERSKAA
jgi:hypothetical protein